MANKFTRFNIQEILMDAGLDTQQARKTTAKIIEALSDSLAEGEPVELRGLFVRGIRPSFFFSAIKNPPP